MLQNDKIIIKNDMLGDVLDNVEDITNKAIEKYYNDILDPNYTLDDLIDENFESIKDMFISDIINNNPTLEGYE